MKRPALVVCGAALGVLGLAMLAMATYWTWTYDDTWRQVARKMVRATALQAVAATVAVFDPSAPHVRPAFGVSPLDQGRGDDAPVPRTTKRSVGAHMFRYGRYPRDRAERISAELGLARFVDETLTRYAALGAHSKWRRGQSAGGRPSDLYVLHELTNFTNQLWDHANDHSTVDFASFDVSEVAKRGRNGERFFCQVYAMGLLELARILGYRGRILTLSINGTASDHAVVEVWLPDIAKWVVFDADFNLFYGDPEHPLHAVEVQSAYFDAKGPPLTHGRDRASIDYLGNRGRLVARSYRNIEWHMRDDFWSNPYFRGHPDRSDANSLLWRSPHSSNVLRFKPSTDELSDAYFPVASYTVRVVKQAPLDADIIIDVQTSYPGTVSVAVLDSSGAMIPPLGARTTTRFQIPRDAGLAGDLAVLMRSAGFATVRRQLSIPDLSRSDGTALR